MKFAKLEKALTRQAQTNIPLYPTIVSFLCNVKLLMMSKQNRDFLYKKWMTWNIY